MADPLAAAASRSLLPSPLSSSVVVVPCTFARVNAILDPPRPSTKGQRGIITRCWPDAGPVSMVLLLKISVLLGPLSSTASKQEAGKHNALVRDFFRAGWPECYAFWKSISSRKSRLAVHQVAGEPPAYDGSEALWTPGEMIMKEICRVKQEAGVSAVLYGSLWFLNGCTDKEKSVLRSLALKLREIAPNIGVVLEPPSVDPSEFWLVVRPQVVPSRKPKASGSAEDFGSSALSMNDYILNMIGSSSSVSRNVRPRGPPPLFEGLRDRSDCDGYDLKRPPDVWVGRFSSCVDLDEAVERATALARDAFRGGSPPPVLLAHRYNVLGECDGGYYPPLVQLGKWEEVVQERVGALLDDLKYSSEVINVFDRDWLGRTSDLRPFTSFCLNYDADVSLAVVGPLVNVDVWRHSRSTSVSASDVDAVRRDVDGLRSALGKSRKVYKAVSSKDIEKLRSTFERLARKVNKAANGPVGEKRSRFGRLFVNAVGDLVPFGISLADLSVSSDDDDEGDSDVASQNGGDGYVSDSSVREGVRDSPLTSPTNKRHRRF